MDRNREARRTAMGATNGLPRRRHRSSSLRNSPDEDGAVELQETARLRDRGSGGKKDRDRDRDRERERDRDRERDRERDRMNRSKRRRGGERLGGDESSEESVNDEEDEDDDDGGLLGSGGGGSGLMRMLPPPNPAPTVASMSSSLSLMGHQQHHNRHVHNHHNSNNQRKSFPPAKNFRAPPPAALKAADEMIGVSVPRKARSVSTKRSHEWSSPAIGIVGDQIHRQASTSPVRQSLSSAATAAAASASQAPVSPPSSSNVPVRKKLKHNGPKLRQPKPSPKPSSSAQDEIEIEIAEVLYGMMRQPQGPSKEMMANEVKLEYREANNKSASDANKSSGDAKSRASSPISNPQYGAPQSSSRSSQPGGDSAVPAWAFCVAPKRKKPRLVKYDGKYEDGKLSIMPSQNNPISSLTTRLPTEQQSAKTEGSSANLEKSSGSAAENGGLGQDAAQSNAGAASSEAQQEPMKQENSLVSDSKPGAAADKSEGRDSGLNKEKLLSPKKESLGQRLDEKRDASTTTKPSSIISEIDHPREEKFHIDLMAPPSRSSPERDAGIDFVAVDAKSMAMDADTEAKPVIKEDAKVLKLGREPVESLNVEPEKPKAAVASSTSAVEESESRKPPAPSANKERNIDLQLDLEKTDAVRESFAVGGNKVNQLVPLRLHHQQQTQQPLASQPSSEKPAQSGALTLPTMSMTGWPGGLPPMGYMTPLQGVVSMDGGAVPSAAIQPQPYAFNQPRPKRCATHCYIARSISYHQQIARMNFWPAAAAAGSGPLYGGKPCNINGLPSHADQQGNISGGRGVNPTQDKGQGLTMFSGHNAKDKVSQAAASVVDSVQRKQILLQQSLPSGAPSNLLQGPAIIFPLSQQQAVAAAASVRPGSVKSPPASGNTTALSASNNSTAAAAASVTAAAAAGAPAMTFNYPNMSGNEHPQYLAINAYSFPIPAHVGAPPNYRGTHAQAMPFFNGSFYSTFHPSQLQQQQPPQQQNQQAHQTSSMSSGSSSSQKHLQNQQQQQQRPHNSAVSLQGFPTSKNPSSQPMQIQMQQRQGQHMAHQARQLDSETAGEDSPSTADSRVPRPSMSIYGQNFAMPMHAPNFAMIAGGSGANGPSVEKKQPPSGQKNGGVEPSQAFAMSFGPGGPPPGIDMASLAQQQAMFPVPDMRQGYQQYMAAAAAAVQAQAAAQHKKNYWGGPEDGKISGDPSNAEDDRKAMKGASQSIAFSRPDLADAPGASVVDSSARTLNLGSAQQRSSNVNVSTAQQQLQRNQHQQQQQHLLQMQKQHQQQQQLAAAAARPKPPQANNGGGVYSEHLSSSMAAKFPNALSTFPQSLVHSSTSPANSPQWKNQARSTTSQLPSPPPPSSHSLKSLSQQQGRPQQSHTQISFATASPKSSSTQPVSSNNQSPSPPIMSSSPKSGAGGSPRTGSNPASAGNKPSPASSLLQQAKNSQPHPSMKPSPATGKNAPSILGNPGAKSQLPQQQAQQISKQSLQQAQQFFSYMPTQVPHSNSPTAGTAPGGYYTQRRRPEGAPGTSPSGMLSLSPSVSGASDPGKANMKGLPSQAGLMHPAQFAAAAAASGNPHQILPAGFPYVQVKSTEQKQPAGE